MIQPKQTVCCFVLAVTFAGSGFAEEKKTPTPPRSKQSLMFNASLPKAKGVLYIQTLESKPKPKEAPEPPVNLLTKGSNGRSIFANLKSKREQEALDYKMRKEEAERKAREQAAEPVNNEQKAKNNGLLEIPKFDETDSL